MQSLKTAKPTQLHGPLHLWFAPMLMVTSSQWKQPFILAIIFAKGFLKNVNAVWLLGYCGINQNGDIHKLPAAPEPLKDHPIYISDTRRLFNEKKNGLCILALFFTYCFTWFI